MANAKRTSDITVALYEWNKLTTRNIAEDEKECFHDGIEFIWEGKTPEIDEEVLVYNPSTQKIYTDIWVDYGEGIGFEDTDEELLRWVYHERNQETLAAAWINGYTVEKEKRYLVKMKNLRALFCYLAYIPDEGYWTFMASGGESIVIKHTRKELEKAGFGEVFNSPLFEIEEVEE